MISLRINGLEVAVAPGTTVLEAARFAGFAIPTLCHLRGLAPRGACRLCLVEIGEAAGTKLATSCTYRAQEALDVRTASPRVVQARKLVLELLLATCPQSDAIRQLAAACDVSEHRFRQRNDLCILCGRCVQTCARRGLAKAAESRQGGRKRALGGLFDLDSEQCRRCGVCIDICPVYELRGVTDEPNGMGRQRWPI